MEIGLLKVSETLNRERAVMKEEALQLASLAVAEREKLLRKQEAELALREQTLKQDIELNQMRSKSQSAAVHADPIPVKPMKTTSHSMSTSTTRSIDGSEHARHTVQLTDTLIRSRSELLTYFIFTLRNKGKHDMYIVFYFFISCL